MKFYNFSVSLKSRSAMITYMNNVVSDNDRTESLEIYPMYQAVKVNKAKCEQELDLMAKYGKISKQAKIAMINAINREFAEFMCEVWRLYRVHSTHTIEFIQDLDESFDNINCSIEDYKKKSDTIDAILDVRNRTEGGNRKNRAQSYLTPEQITYLENRKHDLDGAIEEEKMNEVIA